MCSRIYPDHLIDDLYLFDEIIIDSCFTAKFKTFFKPEWYLYLDVKHPHDPHRMFFDVNRAKFYRCMHFVS